jgi:lipopolysaccharide/colanic/teichoic acid biosynthesis glycosyltransferase
LKKLFDITAALILLIILLPVILIISLIIKIDSEGTVMFRQTRVTQYGKEFRIFKFRTMVPDAERLGSQVTAYNDMRVTRVGRFLRKCRLDEVPQLFNILTGDMTFVGTRPEVIKYTEHYTDKMKATLLLPAGITSEASIKFKDEDSILSNAALRKPLHEKAALTVGGANRQSGHDAEQDDVLSGVDAVYIQEILPEKMRYNLEAIEHFNFFRDVKTMFKTVFKVIKRDEK